MWLVLIIISDSDGYAINTNVTLVIPSFTQATTYTCGRRISGTITQVGQPSVNVTLTIAGELINSHVNSRT